MSIPSPTCLPYFENTVRAQLYKLYYLVRIKRDFGVCRVRTVGVMLNEIIEVAPFHPSPPSYCASLPGPLLTGAAKLCPLVPRTKRCCCSFVRERTPSSPSLKVWRYSVLDDRSRFSGTPSSEAATAAAELKGLEAFAGWWLGVAVALGGSALGGGCAAETADAIPATSVQGLSAGGALACSSLYRWSSSAGACTRGGAATQRRTKRV